MACRCCTDTLTSLPDCERLVDLPYRNLYYSDLDTCRVLSQPDHLTVGGYKLLRVGYFNQDFLECRLHLPLRLTSTSSSRTSLAYKTGSTFLRHLFFQHYNHFSCSGVPDVFHIRAQLRELIFASSYP